MSSIREVLTTNALLAGIASLALTPPTVSALSWDFETVDVADGSVSLAVDSNGYPHISYMEAPYLKYAYYNGTEWHIEVLDENVAAYNDPGTSIALDSSDNPHISYSGYEGGNYTLKYASFDGTDWELVTASSGGAYRYEHSDIAVDSSGNPHIVYRELVDEPFVWCSVYWYCYYNGYEWNRQIITHYYQVFAPHLAHISIVIDSYDTPHLVCKERLNPQHGPIHIVYINGVEWEPEILDNMGYGGLDIAVDGEDGIHVMYSISEDDAGYAYFDGTEWELETIENLHDEPVLYSIVTASNNYPRASFGGDVDGDSPVSPIFAFYNGYDWLTEPVGDNANSHSISLDSNDDPLIAYVESYDELILAKGHNAPPSSFNLSQPPDSGEIPEPVTLDWEDSTDDDGDTITYDVWYATDPSFDPHDDVTELTDSTYTFPEGVLTQGETYFWKVRATDGWDETWSGPDACWSFTVNAPPGDFDLTAPPDGAVVAEPVTLDWEDSIDPGPALTVGAGSTRAGADKGNPKFTRTITYDVWYAKDPSFDPHDEVTDLTDSTYTFPEGVLTQGETYYWKVRAWDGWDETWSGPDPYWSFTVEDEVTDIPVASFSAESARNGVELTWECTDPGVGFNLYRSEETTGVRTKLREIINAELIIGESPYSYLDAEVSDGVTYSYWLEAIDVGGASETFGPVSCTAGTFVPSSYALYQSRPNPARGTAVIAFDLPENAEVTLTIYDLSGRKVTTLVNETLPAGGHERPVAGLAPGVYIYRLVAGEFNAVRKMVVVE